MPSSDGSPEPTLSHLFDLSGRVALVAGGAGVLGSALAAALAELGAATCIASRDVDRCRETADTIAADFDVETSAVPLDVTDSESVVGCMEAALETHGQLDILVNSAWSGRKNSLDSITEDDWRHDVEVSLNGTWRLVNSALAALRAQRGVILNVSSMYGHIAPDPGLYEGNDYTNPPSYGAAKAGVIQFTRYLASFLARDGVRANCISPGAFPHEGTRREDPEFIERLGGHNPLGRVGEPYELKGAVALLCSDAGSYITGENLRIDGGWAVR